MVMLVKKAIKRVSSQFIQLLAVLYEKSKKLDDRSHRATAVIKRPTFYQKKEQKVYEFEKTVCLETSAMLD